jgi:hypothetical protein
VAVTLNARALVARRWVPVSIVPIRNLAASATTAMPYLCCVGYSTAVELFNWPPGLRLGGSDGGARISLVRTMCNKGVNGTIR